MDRTPEEIADELLAKAGFGFSKSPPKRAPEGAQAVTLDDFFAYMPMHNYIYEPSREPWPGASVNARIPPVPLMRNGEPVLDDNGEQVMQTASAWLDQNKPVEQMTWAPGLPMIIRDRLVSAGGWIERKGVSCFNLYRPPEIELGDADEAGPWLAHVHRLYSKDDAHHVIQWLAHRRQRPQEKINHALLLGGPQGIGKDTMLEPPKRAIGPWNFSEVSPQHMFGRFNGFLKSVILRVSEARDLGDVNRYSFYDHLKAYTAAPPDVLRVDEKNLREYSVLNCCGVIITTNHKADGVYLPADDRRHYVAWSDLKKEDFAADYWNRLWAWYENGGYGHVAAYLTELDISDFDPKAPPPKTAAFWDIVDANRAPEDAELADVLDELGNPDVTTLAKVQGKTTGDFDDWIRDRRNRRQIPYRFERCGYVPVRNEVADDGLWVINKKRQVVYGRATLSLRERLKAAQKLTGQTPTSGNPPVSDVGEISDLASPLDSAKTPQFNGESQITDFTASTDGRKSATSAKQLKSKAKTGRGAKAPKPRSDDLLYTGPVVPVPGLGPDPLDDHGVPVAQAQPANGSEPGLSVTRIRELRQCCLDRAEAQRRESGEVDMGEIEEDLRIILREEVLPEFVEIEFERVMAAVFGRDLLAACPSVHGAPSSASEAEARQTEPADENCSGPDYERWVAYRRKKEQQLNEVAYEPSATKIRNLNLILWRLLDNNSDDARGEWGNRCFLTEPEIKWLQGIDRERPVVGDYHEAQQIERRVCERRNKKWREREQGQGGAG